MQHLLPVIGSGIESQNIVQLQKHKNFILWYHLSKQSLLIVLPFLTDVKQL